MKIKIYFSNGNVAIVPGERVKFYAGFNHPAALEEGEIAVNWGAVSWVREYEEPDE